MELLGKTEAELRKYCVELGEPAYRGSQLYRALYVERNLDSASMTNLPLALRQKLAEVATITLPKVSNRYHSADGSVRYLFALPTDGEESRRKVRASVEAVFMPSEGRQTICISTQAGCAVDCKFCLTAQLGLIRNLKPGEILGQVLVPLKEMENSGVPQSVSLEAADEDAGTATGLAARTNVVLMGQGEPLLNFENVMAAVQILLDPKGIGLSPKHVTLSTSGIVPGIERLGKEAVRPKLAISLNASNDEQRNLLMPINRKYPLKALMDACRAYPLRSWEHLTFEYVMLGKVNDSVEDARRVVRLLASLGRVKVNLIPWNPGELPYAESSVERIEEFRKTLVDRGVPAFVRYSRGRDVMAACGQLALKEVQGNQLTTISL